VAYYWYTISFIPFGQKIVKKLCECCLEWLRISLFIPYIDRYSITLSVISYLQIRCQLLSYVYEYNG
jgi:hypothetical protein